MDSKYIDKKPLFDWQLKHVLYAYGDKEKISWLIESDEKTVFENREHVENYKDKISNSESKTIEKWDSVTRQDNLLNSQHSMESIRRGWQGYSSTKLFILYTWRTVTWPSSSGGLHFKTGWVQE